MLQETLNRRFGLKSFRPHQEDVCVALSGGRDVLLVMPTGAGKSLCYQLPGITRGGVTLVISPLIALIDDQVGRLLKQGFRAAGLHGGMERATLREVSARYLAGDLDFLFVAPERFAVPRFPEMLLRRRPTLIAVDEAHCISEWGHDFRHDYRLLGERLGEFRPTPVIAMTATATPEVQRDIVAQLRLKDELRAVHGFWRSNIAVELIDASPDEREELARSLLAEPARRPAIVYAPTRKKAELLAAELKQDYRAAFYHAGMEPLERERVQSEFLSGRIEVIVATVAFGMGIDKADVRTVIHAALPGSVEAYYQEIGRAGRDGKSSRAFLLHSPVDEQTQRFFLRVSYPEVSVLERVLAGVPLAVSVNPDALRQALRLDPKDFKSAVLKLVSYRALQIDATGMLSRLTRAGWQQAYEAHHGHKLSQLQAMTRFTESKSCRMAALVRYFGDQGRERCGHCDICAPEERATRSGADERQDKVIARALFALYQMEETGTASLFKTAIPDELMDRRAFEHVLTVMERDGWITLNAERFEKDGKSISFTKVRITTRGKDKARQVETDIPIWVESGKQEKIRSARREDEHKFDEY